MANDYDGYPGDATNGPTFSSTDNGGVHTPDVAVTDQAGNPVAGTDGATAPAAGVLVLGQESGGDAKALNVLGSTGTLYVLPSSSGGAISSTNHGAAADNGLVNAGARAQSSVPTPVDAGDEVAILADLEGRAVTAPYGVRGTTGQQYTNVTATGDDVVDAGATGVKRDLVYLNIENTDSSAATVTLKDSAGGSTVLVTVVPANSAREFRFSVPLKQTTAANVWEVAVTTGGSIALHVTAQYTETKQ